MRWVITTIDALGNCHHW